MNDNELLLWNINVVNNDVVKVYVQDTKGTNMIYQLKLSLIGSKKLNQ
jgi:hypothetical protein